MSKKYEDRQNIVVVGGGHAGTKIAYELAHKLDITKFHLIIINPRPYMIFLPTALRLAVSDAGQLETNGRVDITRIFPHGEVSLVVGKVKSIEKAEGGGGTVVLEDGEQVPFRILVLTPGSIWTGPAAFPDGVQDVEDFTKRNRASLKKAENIVLVGGGAVGIEFAGEIKDIYPNKRVTIVHSDRALMNSTYPDKFRKALHDQLAARGVEIILEERVDVIPPFPTVDVTTQSGRKIPADLVVSTTGPRPNTAFVAASLGSDVLDEGGYVKVQPTLQVLGHPDIFSAGDVIDVKEQKQAVKILGQGPVIVGNILASLDGRPLKKQYKGSTEMILLTNGKEQGLAYLDILWGIILGSWVARMFKSRTLMVKEQLAAFGL